MQRQNETAIRDLTRGLGKFALTKSEKLQIVNLAPRQLVELYVIVENLEERFNDDELNEMLQLAEKSFLVAPSVVANGPQTVVQSNETHEAHTNGIDDTDGNWQGDGMDNYFVHETGGADDLEMDDTEE